MSTESPRPGDPEEIEQNIEGTRAEIADTLDALESKLSPRRRLNAAKESMRETGERLARTGADLARSGMDALTPSITSMIRVDHTHVLALLRRFKPYTPLGKKRALAINACLALEVHAQLEEEIFYPALEATGEAGETLTKSVTDHQRMREMIALLRGLEPGEPTFDEMFHSLMREVLHHVADEETTLLPLAEDILRDRLGELGLQMTRRRMELLKPHLGEVARTSARSFPVLTGAAAVGVLALGWLAFRPRRRMH